MPTSRPRRSTNARIARPAPARRTNASAICRARSATSTVAPSRPLPHAAARSGQFARGVRPRGPPRRHDPDDKPRQDAQDREEHEHAGVERDLVQAREHARCEGKEGWKPQPGDDGTNRTAAEREHQAFVSTTPGRSVRAQQRTARPRLCARQQHCEVHAQEKEHDADGELHHRQRPAQPAESSLAPWRELDGPSLVAVRKRLRVFVEGDLHRGLGL